jgi:hypothetical protein
VTMLDLEITHVSPQDLLRTVVGGETRYLAP